MQHAHSDADGYRCTLVVLSGQVRLQAKVGTCIGPQEQSTKQRRLKSSWEPLSHLPLHGGH